MAHDSATKRISIAKDQVIALDVGSGEHLLLDIHEGVKADLFLRADGDAKINLKAGKDSVSKVIVFTDQGRVDAVFDLDGESSDLELAGIFIGRADHHLSMVINHNGARSNSLIGMRGLALDGAEVTAYGSAVMRAKGSRSNLSDHVLLLGDAKVVAEPAMEVLMDEVAACHASSTSRISDDQVFYLNSRGIAREDADYLISEGFLLSVIPQERRDAIKPIISEVWRK